MLSLSDIAAAALDATLGAIGDVCHDALSRHARDKITEVYDTAVRGQFSDAERDVLEDLRTTQVSDITLYLRSDDFDLIARRIILASWRAGRAHVSHDQRIEIERLMVLVADVDQPQAVVVGETIANHMLSVVEAYITAYANEEMKPSTILLEGLPAPTVLNSVDDAFSTLLANTHDLASVDSFVTRYNAQFVAVRDRMELPGVDLTAKREVTFEDLFVQPAIEANSWRTTIFGSRTVYRGDPGGGKSTLVQHRALAIIATPYTVCPATAFLLRLREIARDIVDNRQTIVECIEAQARSVFQVTAPPNAVEYLLYTGRATVIFDGLDEIPVIADRQKIVDAVHAFANSYPDATIEATSRRIGYELAPLNPGTFDLIDIQGFHAGQVSEYVRKRLALEQGLTEIDRERRLSTFMTLTTANHDLRSNPLLLSLMVHLHRSSGHIPQNRPDLYKQCTDLLYRMWDASRSIESHRPYDSTVRYAIAELAEWMLRTDPEQQGIPRARVITYLAEHMQKLTGDGSQAKAEETAEEVIDFCTGRAWVLTDLGADLRENRYGFTHRTFLEYFTAINLRRNSQSMYKLADRLLPYIRARNLEVIWEICVQIAAEEQYDAADTIVTEVLNAVNESQVDSYAATQFAVRALQLCTLKPELRQRIVNLAITTDEHSADSAISPVDRLIPRLLTAAPLNRDTVAQTLYAHNPTNYWVLFNQVMAWTVVDSHGADETCRAYWQSPDILATIEQLIARQPATLPDDWIPGSNWWTLTRFAYNRDVNLSEVSLHHMCTPLFYAGVAGPPFTARLLQSMLTDLADSPNAPSWPTQVTRHLADDPEQCAALTAILLSKFADSSGARFDDLGPLDALETITPQYIPNLNTTHRDVLSLIAVLAAIHTDYDTLRGLCTQSTTRLNYWNWLLHNNLTQRDIGELNVTPEVREFLRTWFRRGITTLRH